MTESLIIFDLAGFSPGQQPRDGEGPVLASVSESFGELLGYTDREVLGTPLLDYLYADSDRQCLFEILQQHSVGQRAPEVRDIRLKSRSGEKIRSRFSVVSMGGSETGSRTLCVARLNGCGEQVELALVESEQRFRQMADMTGEWLWEQDPDGHYTYSSTAVGAILGYSPAEVEGHHYTEFFYSDPASPPRERGVITREKRGSFFNIRNRYRHRDGYIVTTESTGVPIQSNDGALIKWRGVDRDVTARLRVQEEIRQAQVKLAVAHHEMKIARKIQESLLPSVPLVAPGVHVQGFCLSADQVGGDYFDYFCRDAETVDVVIADVSGHAVGPALFMVETRSALRSQSQLATDPGETLFMMNRFLYEDLSQSDHFITMFYLQYCNRTRELRYANAGHNPPLLKKAGESSCRRLDAEGLILGIKDVVCFEQKAETLESGDTIVLYTDGLTEAQNPAGSFFGVDRLCRLVTQYAASEPREIIRTCIDEVRSFRGNNTIEDDLTIVVLRITDPL